MSYKTSIKRKRNSQIFLRLQEVLGDELTPATLPDYVKSEVEGYMPLSLDKIDDGTDAQGNRYTVISLAHNYVQNGDLMRDPDMEIAIHWFDEETRARLGFAGTAEALTYQQDGMPQGTLYQEVYDTFPNPKRVRTSLRANLNAFLLQWLRNARDQGHRLAE